MLAMNRAQVYRRN